MRGLNSCEEVYHVIGSGTEGDVCLEGDFHALAIELLNSLCAPDAPVHSK